MFSGENNAGAKDSLPLADHDESAYENHMALYEVSTCTFFLYATLLAHKNNVAVYEVRKGSFGLPKETS